MDDINIYYNSSIIVDRKIPSKIVSWVTILIGLLIFILLFGNFVEYKKYQKVVGIVKNNAIIVLIEPNMINKMQRTLIINNKEYNFEINSISEDYTILDNKNYYEMILDIDLDNKYKINNNILELNIELGKTTLIKEIIIFLKKGME